MILDQLIQKKKRQQKSLAVLIDPDKTNDVESLNQLIELCTKHKVDYLLVGGSLLTTNRFSFVIENIKSSCDIPVIIFPGNHQQIDSKADGILLLSLISGRNPDFLIGQHVHAAPLLKASGLEVISVGYMLINSGPATSASYMSNTTPIPADKPDIAACTAMAGELLGLKMLYLEAGSGAQAPISQEVITKVTDSVDIPVIVGGGLNSIQKVEYALDAGADLIVVGNALEKDPSFLSQVAKSIQAKTA